MTNNRQRDKKISDFLATDTVGDSDYLNIVQNGTNYKVSKSDFVAGLGVSGSIVQDGAVTGVPVLDTQGTVNNIRNIEAGAGISASVSPENGLTLKHNFLQDVVGSPILVNPTAVQPAIASLEAGDGISIVSVDNHIEISVSGTPESTKTVIVNELSDFPTPVANVITLQDDREYLITNDVSVGINRFVFNNSTIRGSESTLITLTYTGTGDLFTVTDKTVRVSNISVSAATGRIFNWTQTTGSNILRVNDVTIVACDKVGLFTGATGILRFTNVSPAVITTDGLAFTGNFRSFLWEVSAANVSGGALFNLGTATFDSFIADSILLTIGAGTNLISGAASSANINVNGSGSILNNRVAGLGTTLSGLATSDSRWEYRSNDGIDDTFQNDGLFQGNITISSAEDTGIQVDPANPSFGWRDIEGSIAYSGTGSTSPQLQTFKNNQRFFTFDTTSRRAQFVFHIPHDYVKGTDLYFHVHWAHTSATITSGVLTWSANMMYAKGHNQAPFGTEVTSLFAEAGSLTQYQHMVTEVQASISGGSATQLDTDLIEPDGLVTVNLQVFSNTMDGGAIPFVQTADIHYQTSNIATKNKAPNFYA